MKKLLLLMIALLAGVSGAWADDWTPSLPADGSIMKAGPKASSITAATSASDNAHWYLITQLRGGESAIYDTGTQIFRGGTDKTPASFNGSSPSTNNAYLVRFISTGSSGIYNIQFGTGRYAKNYDSDPGNVAVGTDATAGSYAFYNCNGGTGSYFGWNLGTDTGKSVNNNSAGYSVAFWGSGKRSGTSTSDNAIWYVYSVEIGASVSMTYKVIVNGIEKASATENQPAGGTLSVPSSAQKPFCDYEFYSTSALTGEPLTTIPAEATTVYAKPIWNGPFKISTDFENATWNYLMQSHQEGTKNYVSYSEGNACPVSGTKPTTDNGLWAFIGNAYDGFKIINKGAEDGKYLQSTDNYPTMTTTQTEWIIANRSGYNSSYFNIHSGSTNYINLNNSEHILKYWDNSSAANDNNSTFRVEEYSEDFTSEVATYITPYFENPGVYFSITNEAYTANLATWTAAKSSCNKATYNSLSTIVSNNIKYPADGWYLIKNNSTEHYINTTGSTSAVTTTNNAPSSVVYLDNRDNGTYYILSQGEYFQTPSVGYAVTRSSTPVAFTPEVATAKVVSFKAGSYGLADSGGTLGGGYLRGTATDPASYWTVEDISEITASITNAKDNTDTERSYATLCVPFAISALTGANAYMPTVSGDYVELGDAAEVSDGTLIPAGTPVILVGAKDAGTYTATIKSGAPATSPATTNVLTGTFAGTSFDCTSGTSKYVLGFDSTNDNRIGFYHVSGGSSFALKANRAYLNTSAGVKGFAISFGDIIDSIKAMDNTPVVHDGPIFNLAGQRMNKLQRGVNIVKGKKVVVK